MPKIELLTFLGIHEDDKVFYTSKQALKLSLEPVEDKKNLLNKGQQSKTLKSLKPVSNMNKPVSRNKYAPQTQIEYTSSLTY